MNKGLQYGNKLEALFQSKIHLTIKVAAWYNYKTRKIVIEKVISLQNQSKQPSKNIPYHQMNYWKSCFLYLATSSSLGKKPMSLPAEFW